MQVSQATPNHNSQKAKAMHATTTRRAPFQGFKPLAVVMALALLLACGALLFGVSLQTVGLGLVDVLIFALIGTAMLRGLEPSPSAKLDQHPTSQLADT